MEKFSYVNNHLKYTKVEDGGEIKYYIQAVPPVSFYIYQGKHSFVRHVTKVKKILSSRVKLFNPARYKHLEYYLYADDGSELFKNAFFFLSKEELEAVAWVKEVPVVKADPKNETENEKAIRLAQEKYLALTNKSKGMNVYTYSPMQGVTYKKVMFTDQNGQFVNSILHPVSFNGDWTKIETTATKDKVSVTKREEIKRNHKNPRYCEYSVKLQDDHLYKDEDVHVLHHFSLGSFTEYSFAPNRQVNVESSKTAVLGEFLPYPKLLVDSYSNKEDMKVAYILDIHGKALMEHILLTEEKLDSIPLAKWKLESFTPASSPSEIEAAAKELKDLREAKKPVQLLS